MAAPPVERGAALADGSLHISDVVRLGAEIVSRQIYWRLPALPKWYHALRESNQGRQVADLNELRDFLSAAGLGPERIALVHAALEGVGLGMNGGIVDSPLAVGSVLLQEILRLTTDRGTLAMPTHPKLAGDPGFMFCDKASLELEYEPALTPSSVGLLSDLFRRRRGVIRSLHPLSSVACCGPLAATLLEDNLLPDALPHGITSPYNKISRLNGVIVSLGKPLIQCMTMLHVAEEVRDSQWPVPGFFYHRRFTVRHGGVTRRCVVRERRPEFVRALGLGQVRRDLSREGILKEGHVGTLRVDHADARDVVDYLLLKSRHSTYPYFFPRLAHF